MVVNKASNGLWISDWAIFQYDQPTTELYPGRMNITMNWSIRLA